MNPRMKSLQDVRALAGAELSLKSRIGYVALLLVSLGMTAVIVSLWVTEPALPARTRWAFAAMTLIGASWIALSAWALRARRPLFARDRVIAGRMAVAFTAVFAAAALAAVIWIGNGASYGMLATGVVMLAVALRALVSAGRRHAQLLARRASLAG